MNENGNIIQAWHQQYPRMGYVRLPTIEVARKGPMDNATLVYLTISLPGQTKTDRQESIKVEQENHAQAGRARVVKRLFSKESFGPVQAAAQRVRMLHYKLTLGWDDTGARVLGADRMLDYMHRINAGIEEFQKAGQEFEAEFENIMAREKERLGFLFNRNDYPNVASYDARVHFRPFGGWRVVGKEEQDILEQSLRESINKGIVKMMDDAFSRIEDVVQRMVSKLAVDAAIFRDSLLSNVLETADILEGLNVTSDPRLTQTIRSIRKLASSSPAGLRRDKEVRQEVVTQGQRVLAELRQARGG